MAACLEDLPTLSVIIAVHNAVSSIGRTLDSVVAQHYPKLDLVVCDNLSTDGTMDVLGRYSRFISVLKSECDTGPSDAYNRAFSLVKGDYVGILNADDEYEPGALWAVADSILKNPDTDVVSFGMLYRTSHRQCNRIVTGYYAGEAQLELTLKCVLSELPTFALSRFVRNSLIKSIGEYNTDRASWYISCDREWMTRLVLLGCKNVIIPKALYGFYSHPESISGNPRHFLRIIEEHMHIADKLLTDHRMSDEDKLTVRHWQNRQLAFGFWKGLVQWQWNRAWSFMKRGIAVSGWGWCVLSAYVLGERLLKRLGLRLSNGIDRG